MGDNGVGVAEVHPVQMYTWVYWVAYLGVKNQEPKHKYQTNSKS